MGYFDALTSGYFKTEGQDGRKLFFPWGIFGRGYVIASEQDYERLRRQLKVYTIVAMVLIIGPVALQRLLWAFVIAALLTAFYIIWAHYLLRGLQRSNERLSLQDSMTTQALAHSAGALWLLEVASLVFVGGGILMLADDPSRWLRAVFTITFFGLCAAQIARMLVLRRRSRLASGQ